MQIKQAYDQILTLVDKDMKETDLMLESYEKI